MTFDPAVVAAAMAAMGGLLILVVRLFITGTIMSRNVVPREDYDNMVKIHADYVSMFGASVEAIRDLSADLRTERAKNGKA